MTSPDTTAVTDPQLAAQVAEYQEQGYTIIEGFLSSETCAAVRESCDRLSAGDGMQPWHRMNGRQNWWLADMLERESALMWPIISDPRLLDLCEAIVGPFVQLDNLTLAAFPSVERETAAGKVTGWHRDRWAQMPTGHYAPPMAWNGIAYMQDLTDEVGPLRVIPGSHIEPIAITPDEITKPHPREKLVHAKAGDLVLTHNGLLHSGTPNVSGNRRYFFSIYMQRWGLSPTDNLEGPTCAAIREWCRRREDRRGMRLMADTRDLQSRVNCAFREPDHERWARWQADDAKAMAAAAKG